MPNQSVPIFTYLHGEVAGKLMSDPVVTSEGDLRVVVPFRVGREQYKAYSYQKTLEHARLVLFDGIMIPHGLLSGVARLDYEYGRDSDPYMVMGHKRMTMIEAYATVHEPEVELPERVVSRERARVEAVYGRYLLALMPHRTCLLARLRPRSLRRQYTSVYATEHEVLWQSLVG